MNKIFKVIWSKSKQCYVVVSEMTKNTTGKKKIIVASVLALLAAQPLVPLHVLAGGMDGGSVKPGTNNNVAYGYAAYAGSDQSIAIGYRSKSSGTFLGGNIQPSIAIGAGSDAAGNNAIAMGTSAYNHASYSVALGDTSKVLQDYGIGIGFQSNVSGIHGIAIGEVTKAAKEGTIAMGSAARGYGNGGIALGYQALTGANVYTGAANNASPYNDNQSTINSYNKWGDAAIGLRALATGGNATALGRSASAIAENAIAIGGGNGASAIDNTEKNRG